MIPFNSQSHIEETPLFWFDYSQSYVLPTELENIGSYGGSWMGAPLVNDTGNGVNALTATGPSGVSITNIDFELWNNNYTIFTTFKLFSLVSTKTIYLFGAISSGDGKYTMLDNSNSIQIRSFYRDNNANNYPLSTTALLNTTITMVQRIDFDTNIRTVVNYSDGFSNTPITATNSVINSISCLLGWNLGNSRNFDNGELYEYRFYNRSFSDDEILYIKQQLDNKWT